MKKEKIIATICELPNEPEPFIAAWQRLVMHVGRHQRLGKQDICPDCGAKLRWVKSLPKSKRAPP